MIGSLVLSLATVAGLGQVSAPDNDYLASITSWREQQAKDLQGPKGWLLVSGLTWLDEGRSTAGSSVENTVILPKSAPEHIGAFTRAGTTITFETDLPNAATSDGKPVTSLKLGPAELTVGHLTLDYIARGTRVGLRLYDEESNALKKFKGLKWFPVQTTYRIQAHFTPYDKPKDVPITNVLGDVQMWPSPGFVTFKLEGKTCKLIALAQGDGLFFNFRDRTSGKSTYPAGRFLDASKPVNGLVDLDFNKATNPPCAFTSYATCPLPPPENSLKVAVTAGEKTHHPEE